MVEPTRTREGERADRPSKGFRRRVFVIGAGRLGRALLDEMRRARVSVVGAWNRDESSAEMTRARCRVDAQHGLLPDTREADIVLLTVPDRHIVPVTERLISRGLVYPTQVLLHCSGAIPAAVMRLDGVRPAAVGCYHPLQTFTTSRRRDSGYFVSTEGESAAVHSATELARALGHPTISIASDKKALYHAGATLASNYLVTLQSAAADLLARAGIPYGTALQALHALSSATLDNVVREGPQSALTGPIARGDLLVVEQHLETLTREAPDLVELYRLLGRYTLAIVTGSQGEPPGNVRMRHLLMDDDDS